MAYPSEQGKEGIAEKLKFYNHLHWFLTVNGLLLFFSLRNDSGFGWVPILIIWGSILLFHFMKVFRPDMMDEDGAHGSQYFLEGPDEDEYFELRQLNESRRKSWSDRDLV